MKNKIKLRWTTPSPPNEKCHYDHTISTTPFGRFLLTWKGWKDYPTYGFDETPWDEVEYREWNSVEEAQEWASYEMMCRVNLLLKSSECMSKSPKFCKDCIFSEPEERSVWNLRCQHPIVNSKDAYSLGSPYSCGVACTEE